VGHLSKACLKPPKERGVDAGRLEAEYKTTLGVVEMLWPKILLENLR
jgi:hypothetical protein